MEIDILLGSGSYGKVYKIKGKNLAMKQIEISRDIGLEELKELNFLRILNHPNILHLEDFVITATYMGLILPIATTDLHKEMRKTDDLIQKWMYQLLSAVHFLHKNGYFHCDIKPANVLLINDNAVLADLGLTGIVMVDDAECQTLASPQRFRKRGVKMTSKIANQESNNYQDDIWALGVTFYYIITKFYSIFLDGEEIDKYATDDYETFLDNRKDKIGHQYIALLTRLLNPNAQARSLNLLELLALPIFSQYHNYVEGTITSVINDNPVIFNRDIVETFKNSIKDVRKLYSRRKTLPHIVLFNTIDMMYRIYEILGKNPNKYLIFSCFYISMKVFANIPALIFDPKAKQTEIDIVKALNGYLTRDLVISYLDPDQYEPFLDWLQENPERYEQCSLKKLAEITRSL